MILWCSIYILAAAAAAAAAPDYEHEIAAAHADQADDPPTHTADAAAPLGAGLSCLHRFHSLDIPALSDPTFLCPHQLLLLLAAHK